MDYVFVFCFGACIGSFLNVCIYRIPAGRSVIYPRSRCACGEPIALYNNIPILSWLFLRGKAGCCKLKIPIRYFIIECLTAFLFVLTYCNSMSLIHFAINCIFFSFLIIAAFVDIDSMEIPDSISIGGMLTGLLISICVFNCQREDFYAISPLNSLIGICFGSGLLLWIAIIGEIFMKREAIGFGDVKLMGLIGAFLGCRGCLFAIFGGCLVSSVVLLPIFLLTKLVKRKDYTIPKEIPFAPFLVVGSIAYTLYEYQILHMIFPKIF